MDRTTNLLGALALGLSDQLRAEIKAIYARDGEAAAALVVIGYVPGVSVEILRQVLGRSHPGTVRLIDRLAMDGHVERRQAVDGRAVALHLTDDGVRLRKSLLEKRLDLLETALTGLTQSERRSLGDLLSKVLTNLPKDEMAKHRICRLCSVTTCTDCPIRANAM